MDNIRAVKEEAKKILIENFPVRKLKEDDLVKMGQKSEIFRFLDRTIVRLLRQNKINISDSHVSELKEEIISELVGYGVIEKLIRDPAISDILVNSPEQIYIEKKGKLEKADVQFSNKEEILNVIERMIADSGKRIDMSSPYVDFRLENGSRVTAVIPPVSVGNPFLCVRKAIKDILTVEDLKKSGTVNQKLLDFLKYCINARLNILVSGSTGVGKTTLINVLMREFIPKQERIVIMEDTEELVVEKNFHTVKLLTRASNIENKGEITLKDLVRLSLHLRPDRIIVGEVRGEEAFHFLHAINTGHEGSMCTVHANNCEDALHRIETLSLMDRPNIRFNVIRHFIDLGLDLIIHMIRLPSGRRVVSQVSEFHCEDDSYVVEDIFSLERSVKNNQEVYDMKFTGHVPSFIDKLKVRSNVPENFFLCE